MDNIFFKTTKKLTLLVSGSRSPLMMFQIHVAGKHSNSNTKFRRSFNSK